MVIPKEKNLPLAIGLNLVLPGVGYMYMSRIGAGIGAFYVFSLVVLGSGEFFLPTWLVLNIIMGIDMYTVWNSRNKKIEKATTVKCPYCAEIIKKEAKVCKHCGREVAIA